MVLKPVKHYFDSKENPLRASAVFGFAVCLAICLSMAQADAQGLHGLSA